MAQHPDPFKEPQRGHVEPPIERKPDEAPADKRPTGKLVLFNHSKNPYQLKDAPPEKEGGSPVKRTFLVGTSIECLDQAEYNMLLNYRGVSTTHQVAPAVDGHIKQLEAEKAALTEKVAALESQLEKFQEKKGR